MLVRRLSTPATLIEAVVLVLGAMAFVFVDPPDDTLFWNSVFDIGHSILFAFIMWTALRVIARAYAPAWPPAWTNLIALGALALLAGLSELVQVFQPNRDANVADLFRDAAGALIMLALYHAVGEPSRTRQVAMRAFAALLVAIIVINFGLVRDVYRQRDLARPTLLAFSGARWERAFITIGRAEIVPAGARHASTDTRAGLLRLQRSHTTAGFTLHEPVPDWTPYSRLVFAVRARAETPDPLTVRVYDSRYRGGDENAFQRNFQLSTAWQKIEIPLDDIRRGPVRRELDLRDVRGVSLFVWRPQQPVELDVEPLRLE